MTGPGLDLTALRGLRRLPYDYELIKRRIEAHLDQHAGYVAFSGGKDSLVTLDLVRQVDPEVPVVFFDSGLEYPETYEYISDLTNQWRLNLQVYRPRLTALEVLVLNGDWSHQEQRIPAGLNLHHILIDEPSARAHRDLGAGEVWGVRANESRGRAAAYSNGLRAERECDCSNDQQRHRELHGGRIVRVDGTVAYGPIWNWKDHEIWSYIAQRSLPVNPVYAKLRALGAPETFLRISHMVDGARLEDGRMVWLKRGWPALFSELARILPRLAEFT